MPRYRKRPIEVKAVHWMGENWEDVHTTFPLSRAGQVVWDPDSHGFLVETVDGRMRCSPGDWLIQDAEGEFYTCKPDVFEQTYEAVEEANGASARSVTRAAVRRSVRATATPDSSPIYGD